MGKAWSSIHIVALALGTMCASSVGLAMPPEAGEEQMVTDNAAGPPRWQARGRDALRAQDPESGSCPGRTITGRNPLPLGDLIDINRASQKTEPALAKSWSVSRDGKQYTLRLRRGIRFSDGQPLTAEDVVFSFQVYLDEKIDSPQRDLLVVGGKPLSVTKVDDYTVRFEMAQPYAAAERLFDGIAILPRHLLESAYKSGSFSEAWSLSMAPSEFAGLGPFRLKEYVPGQRIVLERNPYYWKKDQSGQRLPYLDEVVFLFVSSEDAQVIRFQAGDADLLTRFSAQNFSVLEKQQAAKHYHLEDLGAGLEYNFLFFNLNDLSSKALPEVARKQAWFQDLRFRQAVSSAIDRDSLVRLVYSGRATPLWAQVTPGNKMWIDSGIPHPPRSISHARDLLQCRWIFLEKRWHACGRPWECCRILHSYELFECRAREDSDFDTRRFEAIGNERARCFARISFDGGPVADQLRLRSRCHGSGERRCRSHVGDERLDVKRRHSPLASESNSPGDSVGN